MQRSFYLTGLLVILHSDFAWGSIRSRRMAYRQISKPPTREK